MKLKCIYSHRIFTQLVIFTLLISLVPTLFITGFLFYKLENMVETELLNSYRQMSYQYVTNLEEKLSQYEDSLDVIADNTIILETLTDSSGSPYLKGERISEEVTKSLLLDRQKEIRNCMLYSSLDQNPVYGGKVSMVREALREEWYLNERAMEDDSFGYFSSVGNTPILSLVKRIDQINIQNYKKQQLGFIKLDLYMDRLFEPARTSDTEFSYDVIVCQDGAAAGQPQIFYSSDRAKNGVLEAIYPPPENFSDFVIADMYTVRQYSFSDYGLSIILLFDNHDLAVKRQEIRRMIAPLILIIVLVIILGAWLYSRQFSHRIERLVNKFKKAETGDLKICSPIEGNDEIAELDKQFSHMLGKLDELIQKNYITQLANKEAQLKSLQLQINPHFLYNTLETISSLAAVNQVFGICDICQKLGEIFRYSLGKDYGEFVTVADELRYVKNYIFIIKKRYGERFEVFYNISANIDDVQIIRFILQPIVENAVLHGLIKQTSPGTLELSVWEQEDCLMIRVDDDGIGMDAQKVENLNDSINQTGSPADSSSSIGIRNVNQRIKLACGEEYGIKIKSILHSGSRFDIRLPLIRKGAGSDEAEPIDCGR